MSKITSQMILIAAATAIHARDSRVSVACASYGPLVTDAMGRMHSPADGFEWIDGQKYAAGEFLSDDCGAASTSTAKYLANINGSSAIINSMSEIGIVASSGREFDGLCYVYITGPRYIINALPVQDREIVRADSGLRTGKTWRKGRVEYGYHTEEIEE